MAVKHIAIASLLLAAEGAMACATCSGPADAPQTLGMNAAILTLFGVLCVVSLTGAVFVGLVARRITRHRAEQQGGKISARVHGKGGWAFQPDTKSASDSEPAIGTDGHLGCKQEIAISYPGRAADADEHHVRLRHAPCALCRAGMPNPLSAAPAVSEH